MHLFEHQLETFYQANDEKLSKLHSGLNLFTLKRELTWFYNFSGFNINLPSIFADLIKGRPLAYIIGYQYFYDSFFKVNESTLIPRMETELLVERALQLVSKQDHIFLADIGTGSGAIGLSLAKKLHNCDIHLSDISQSAVSLAKLNYFQQGHHFSFNQKVYFHTTDRLAGIEQQFDLIVSNPPYIKQLADKSQVHEQVLSFEPELALFLKDQEYDAWFEDFFKQVADHLTPSGYFLMEGHEAHLDDLAKLMATLNQFKEIRVIPDLSGRARFIESQKNG